MTLLFELLAVAALILLNGFFVAGEYGLVTVRRTRMEELNHAAAAGRGRCSRSPSRPPRFITAMQLGVTLTSLAIGALGEHALARLFDPWLATVLAVILAYLILTFFHVVDRGARPEGARARPLRADRVGRRHAGADVLRRLPAAHLAAAAIDAARSRRLRARGARRGGRGALGGGVEDARQRLDQARRDRAGRAGDALQGLRLRRQGGRRRDGAAARGRRALGRAPPEQALQAVLDSPYTRYPVYRDSLDDIVGVLHVRDLIAAMHERGIAPWR